MLSFSGVVQNIRWGVASQITELEYGRCLAWRLARALGIQEGFVGIIYCALLLYVRHFDAPKHLCICK